MKGPIKFELPTDCFRSQFIGNYIKLSQKVIAVIEYRDMIKTALMKYETCSRQ